MRVLQTHLISILSLSSVVLGKGQSFKASPGEGKLENNALSQAEGADLQTNKLTRRGVIDVHGIGAMFLNPRQLVCPPGYEVPCIGTDTCCRAGQHCCTTTGGCCPSTQNCFGKLQCCPTEAETCGGKLCVEVAAVCCDDGAYACKPGGRCNTQGGQFCCSASAVSCPGGCCLQGSTCDPNRSGYCIPIETETSTSTTSTRTTTTKTTSSSTTTDPPEDTETPEAPDETTTEPSTPTPTPTDSGDDRRECETDSRKKMKRDPQSPSGWTELDLWKRQTGGTDDDEVGEFCTVNGKEVPVMVFTYVNGLTDAVIQNMCRGIARKGISGNEMILTWAGDGKNNQRRRLSKCPGHCRGVKIDNNEPTSCDEFPFAATLEGGTGAQIDCIPAWQNTLQGVYINNWSSFYRITAGSTFAVRIEGTDCSQWLLNGAKKEKRADSNRVWLDENGQPYPGQDDLITITGAGGTATRIPPVGPDVQLKPDVGYYISALGDVNPGFYILQLRVTGGLAERMKILNGEGLEVQMLDLQDRNSMTQAGNYTFKIDDIDYGLGVVVYSQAKGLTTSFIYSADVKPGNNSEAAWDKQSDAAPAMVIGWRGLLKGLFAIVFIHLVVNRIQ